VNNKVFSDLPQCGRLGLPDSIVN